MKKKKFKIKDHVKKLIWNTTFENKVEFIKFLGVSENTVNRYFRNNEDLLTAKSVKDFIIETYGTQSQAEGFKLECEADIYEPVVLEETQTQAA